MRCALVVWLVHGVALRVAWSVDGVLRRVHLVCCVDCPWQSTVFVLCGVGSVAWLLCPCYNQPRRGGAVCVRTGSRGSPDTASSGHHRRAAATAGEWCRAGPIRTAACVYPACTSPPPSIIWLCFYMLVCAGRCASQEEAQRKRAAEAEAARKRAEVWGLVGEGLEMRWGLFRHEPAFPPPPPARKPRLIIRVFVVWMGGALRGGWGPAPASTRGWGYAALATPSNDY
jgi:hypothetical protein